MSKARNLDVNDYLRQYLSSPGITNSAIKCPGKEFLVPTINEAWVALKYIKYEPNEFSYELMRISFFKIIFQDAELRAKKKDNVIDFLSRLGKRISKY